MPTLRFEVDPSLFVAHPGYRWGLLVIDGADNTAPATTVAHLLRAAESEVRARIQGPVADEPAVAAWREAFRRFGAKPAEHRSAIEALLRRALKPDTLPSINPLVDIGNALALRHQVPVGVHPIARGPGSDDQVHVITLRPARPGDQFAPPDGRPDEPPSPGEIVLADGDRVLTRRWVWRQAAGTQIQPQTRCVFVNVDALPPITDATLTLALDEAANLLGQHVRARVCGRAVLHAGQPRAEFTLADPSPGPTESPQGQ